MAPTIRAMAPDGGAYRLPQELGVGVPFVCVACVWLCTLRHTLLLRLSGAAACSAQHRRRALTTCHAMACYPKIDAVARARLSEKLACVRVLSRRPQGWIG
jgi:hypothetical protein